ncbi:MAG TPA: autotransporter-associated beta strand repeat-containing protein, partial [Verrucomicrobiae bacterium]|nr:autotransporter-associated beta strand repeat-containing protein [Verrucomicrobiae bacterium]
MKAPKTKVSSVLAVVALLWLYSASAFGAGGNWNVDANGNWSVAGNWNPAAVPGTAPGDVIGLIYPVTAARTVTLDVPATVGLLNIGSPTSPYFGYTLSTGSGQAVTLNNNGSGAQIVQATAGGAADTISVALALADNLTVTNVNGLTLSGIISNSPSLSSVTLVKNGAGTLTLSGANTFVASSLTVNAGNFYFLNSGANAGTSGAFGNISGGGMNIYVNSGATLSSAKNNWFGNQTVVDSSLPTLN